MKLSTSGYGFGGTLESLRAALSQVLPRFANQMNAISEGRIVGSHNALTAAPTTGLWQQGDYVRNLTPTVRGSAGSRYVVTGWVCVAGGEPGTWVDCRSATGT